MHPGAGAPDSLRPLELGKTVCKQGGTYNKSSKLNSAGGVLNTRLPSSPLTHVKVNRNRKTHFIILIHYTILKFLFQYINKICKLYIFTLNFPNSLNVLAYLNLDLTHLKCSVATYGHYSTKMSPKAFTLKA